jgi:MoxR-like ATPase
VTDDVLGYDPLFAPTAETSPFDAARAFRLGDRGESITAGTAEPPYVFEPQITLAVNVALAAGRPLLVRGQPGTGKSTLARSVATKLGWRYYAAPVSSRVTARDLQWTFDAVARLAAAEASRDQPLPPREAFVLPGPLWWAFDRDSAARRGIAPQQFAAAQKAGVTPAVDPAEAGDPERAVVLLDEIDKADPDVPNDLLVALGSFRFQVDDGPIVEARQPPLVILTTNEERDLPRAFVRRCVVLTLEPPDDVRLKAIALAHDPGLGESLFAEVLAVYRQIRTRRLAANEPPPSVAELLDALAACRSLRTTPQQTATFSQLATLVLDKATKLPPELP